jgi:MFS family permease
MGAIYFVFMMFGVSIVRIPSEDWKPANWNPSIQKNKRMVTDGHVDADNAIKTPQFYLLFTVLMLNVTAGIGVLGQASVMIQEMFSVESVGENKAVTAIAAGGFVGLLSVFNMLGRFFWSSLSDKIGRKNTYNTFFILGAVLYFLVPLTGNIGSIVLFILCFAIIMSMYGGGFATIPAYLKDMFGTMQVGAIHGRLLLAWSTAAILGPVLINYIRDYQIVELQVEPAQAYSFTMYLMAGLLLIGLIANLSVKPVSQKFFSKTT